MMCKSLPRAGWVLGIALGVGLGGLACSDDSGSGAPNSAGQSGSAGSGGGAGLGGAGSSTGGSSAGGSIAGGAAGNTALGGAGGNTGVGGGAGNTPLGGAAGAAGTSSLNVNDPLYQQYTETVAEWITDNYYTCKNEKSACGLPCPADSLWVAINSTDFRKSAICSACMLVEGPLGSVTVEVIENCAGACKDGEIELSKEAFQLIGDLGEGHANVRWKLVPCKRTGPISFAYEKDSDEWWAGIQVRNPVLPVTGLSIQYSKDAGWVSLKLDGWDHFPVSADLGSGPFDFKVVAMDGQELVETGIAYVPGGVVPGTQQFAY